MNEWCALNGQSLWHMQFMINLSYHFVQGQGAPPPYPGTAPPQQGSENGMNFVFLSIVFRYFDE